MRESPDGEDCNRIQFSWRFEERTKNEIELSVLLCEDVVTDWVKLFVFITDLSQERRGIVIRSLGSG